MPVQTEEVQEYLHRHIPISGSMEFRVEMAGEEGVRLSAPLPPNINHRSTAFGGSVSALAILSAWTLVHVRLREIGVRGHIVIQRNSMEYLRPIHGHFEAFCPAPPGREWERFVQALVRRGRGRIGLSAEVTTEGEVAGTFEGVYVALAHEG